MRLRKYKDHFILLDDGVLVGTTRYNRIESVKSIYMHQCHNAFIGLFHEREIDVDVDMTLDDNGYINQIRRKET